jgi:hypothetical protein
MGASYLHTKAGDTGDRLFNPRDPSAGRADAVIIKDLLSASNCVVLSNSGSAAASNTFVSLINTNIGLRAPTSFGANSGVNGTGAFGVCDILRAGAAGQIAAANALLAPLQPFLNALGGITISNGVPVNIKGNKLPQAPNYKFSVGAQYTAEMSNGMTLVPRADFTYTGEAYGNIFNGAVNKFKGYSQTNAQIQLNGQDEKWHIRAYVQNLFNNASITGLYLTDQSAGNYTNIFTLEPRRYGVAAGFKF